MCNIPLGRVRLDRQAGLGVERKAKPGLEVIDVGIALGDGREVSGAAILGDLQFGGELAPCRQPAALGLGLGLRWSALDVLVAILEAGSVGA